MEEEIKAHAKEFRYIKVMEILMKECPTKSEIVFINAWADLYNNVYLKKLIKRKEEKWKKKGIF